MLLDFLSLLDTRYEDDIITSVFILLIFLPDFNIFYNIFSGWIFPTASTLMNGAWTE